VEQPQIQKPSAPSKPLVSLKNGQMGTLEGIDRGVASVNVDGKIIKEKANQLSLEGPEVEKAARTLLDMIPEGLKSTALMSMVYIPEYEMVVEHFYDGKSAWYKGVPEDVYENIALGTYAPKGEAKTGVAEYKPSVADSRGAGNSLEITRNPLFAKENEGRTWGYAKNEYNLLHSMQKTIHKISKESYDKEGKLIEPKAKKKSSDIVPKKEAPKEKAPEKEPPKEAVVKAKEPEEEGSRKNKISQEELDHLFGKKTPPKEKKPPKEKQVDEEVEKLQRLYPSELKRREKSLKKIITDASDVVGDYIELSSRR
jgi:hypothetical protein